MKVMQRTPLLIVCTINLLFNSCGGAAMNEKAGETRELPAPKERGEISVEEAIAARRSVRSFADSALSEQEMAQILWAAQGVTDTSRGFRAAPSAGATYPLETYVATGEGVFRYLPGRHALETVKSDDVRTALARAALGQGFVREAPATFVFAAVPERTTSRYGERGMMYIHMEAGHAAQNIHIQAVALGLGSVPVGAFTENRAISVLGIPEGQRVLYMVPVGRPR